MATRSPVFGETREHYIRLIAETDPATYADQLGFQVQGDAPVIRLFGSPYRILAGDIVDDNGHPAAFEVCVIISKYVLMCPAAPSKKTDWAAFRDFRDAGPLLKYYADNVEGRVRNTYAGNADGLASAAAAAGGEPAAGDLSYDIKYRFQALPTAGMLLLFNDADNEFPADCRILFEVRVESYLDMESVAILGGMLAHRLTRFAGDG